MADQAYPSLARLASGTSESNAIAFMIRMLTGEMATTMPVQVVAAYPDKLQVDVQPMVAQLDGAGNAVPHGTIFGVPYVRLQAGLAAVIIDPVIGDIGLAVFASHDISAVKANKAPSNPGSWRRFSMSDAIYIGGLLNRTPTTFMQVADAGITITSPNGVTINGALVVNGPITSTEDVTGNGTSLHTHIHSGVTAGSDDTGEPV